MTFFLLTPSCSKQTNKFPLIFTFHFRPQKPSCILGIELYTKYMLILLLKCKFRFHVQMVTFNRLIIKRNNITLCFCIGQITLINFKCKTQSFRNSDKLTSYIVLLSHKPNTCILQRLTTDICRTFLKEAIKADYKQRF